MNSDLDLIVFQNDYIDILIPDTCDCDLRWKKIFVDVISKMRLYWNAWVTLDLGSPDV